MSERPQIRITGPAAAAGRTEWQSRIREHHRANFDDKTLSLSLPFQKPAQLTAIEPGRDPCHRTAGGQDSSRVFAAWTMRSAVRRLTSHSAASPATEG